MKTFLAVAIFAISLNALADTDGVTLTQKEWSAIKERMSILSNSVVNMAQTYEANQLELSALRRTNISIMDANIVLLQERDVLKSTLFAMADCPKAPLYSGPTSAMVSWDIPINRVSGKPLLPTEIGGYFLQYGTNKDNLNVRLKLPDRNTREYTVNGLTPGTYYFSVSVYDVDGVEGPKSSAGSKVIK